MPQISRTETVAIPAGGELVIPRRGVFLRLIDTQSDITVILEGRGGRSTHAGVTGGFAIEGQAFEQIRLQGAAQNVQLTWSNDASVRVEDNRPQVNATVNTTIAPAASVSPLADATVTDGGGAILLAGANANRVELLVSVDASQPAGVRLGDSGLVAGEGVFVPAGGSVVLALRGAVYARNDSGAGNVVVTVAELTT